MPRVDESIIDVVARTMWGEARGEGAYGLQAVGFVIRNRTLDPERWPDEYTEVCYQPQQFSCWNGSDPVRAQCCVVGWNDPVYPLAYSAACQILIPTTPRLPRDNTDGANHYCTQDRLAGSDPPDWVDLSKTTCRVGSYVFFRL